MSEYIDKINEINHQIDEVDKEMMVKRSEINKLRTSRAKYNAEYSKQFIGKCFESHDSYYLITGPAEPQYTLASFIYDDDKMPAVRIEKKLKSFDSVYLSEVDIGAIEMMKEISTEVLRRTFIDLIDKVIDDAQERSWSLSSCSEN